MSDDAEKKALAQQFVGQVAAQELRTSMDAVVQALLNRNVELAVRLRAAEAERDRMAKQAEELAFEYRDMAEKGT